MAKRDLTTEKIVIASASLLILGGLGLAIAYKRRKMRKRREKNLSIQIV